MYDDGLDLLLRPSVYDVETWWAGFAAEFPGVVTTKTVDEEIVVRLETRTHL